MTFAPASTFAPVCATNEPPIAVVESPTSTSLAAFTFAPPSTVTSPVASMSTSVPASTFAPPVTFTVVPASSFVVASDATFAALSARIAPEVFAVRLPFATSSLPLTVSEAVVLPSAVPKSSVEADTTLELPSTLTSPPFASIVIAPLEARADAPPASTPPAPASTSTSPEAPAFAPFVTLTAFPAVTASFLPASAPVTSPVASFTVNVPAFTSVPLPVIVTSFFASSVTPSLP